MKTTLLSKKIPQPVSCILALTLCFLLVSAPAGAQPPRRPESSSGERPEARPETRPETRPTPKPETHPAPKPEMRPTPKPETRPVPKPETRPAPKPEMRPASKPVANLASQPAESSVSPLAENPAPQAAASPVSPLAVSPVTPFAARPMSPPPRRGMNDFEKTLAVLGAVRTVAAIANNSPYYYNRYHYCPPPSVVVVERPVILEKQVIIETPVVIERQTAVSTAYEGLPIEGESLYSPKIGASFRIEYMQIPGYCFTAARLTSDPVEGSPLHEIGLQEGDVITRLNGISVDSLDVLDRHVGNMEIRYIKANTTRVLLTRIYIPTDEEIFGKGEPQYAP